MNASRRADGEYRYHILGCVFGNGRVDSGRMLRVGAGYVAYNPSQPSAARFMASPVWDSDLSDSRAAQTYDIKASYKNITVSVGIPVSNKVGHLEGNFGGRAPQDLPLDRFSLVNTTHAWWQNDCRYGYRCGVTSTRGSVLQATHGFGMDTERSYAMYVQGFMRMRG